MGVFYQIFKNKYLLYSVFQKMEEERTLVNSFYEDNIAPIPNQTDSKKKKINK